MTAKCARIVVSLILALVAAQLPRLASCQSDTCTCDTTMQREALAALYSSTGGPSWFRRDNWMSPTASLCSWYGVSCSGVNLTDNNLEGTLPLMLSQLTGVESFSVEYNPGLRGTLPVGLSNWTALGTFIVASCGLEGTLPVEFLSWTQLTTFVVSNNRLTGTLPSAYSSWTNLQFLRASANALSGTLPETYGSFSRLSIFEISNNALSGTLPASYKTFVELTDFSVTNNTLTGTLPAEYRAWTSLQTFTVTANNLSGTLPSVYNSWQRLKGFAVDANRLEGTLPDAYAAWGKSIDRFSVMNNSMWGTLPPGYKNWTSLNNFEAGMNNFSGTLPPEYGSWRNLTHFVVMANCLHGTLPPKYASFTIMETFMVYKNLIEGTIPPEYQSWRSVLAVSMGTNALTGTLPRVFGTSWKALMLVTLSSNHLSGTIPPEFGQIASLLVLMLESNNFLGTIPSTFANKYMLALSLHNNTNFGGPLLSSSSVPYAQFVTLCHTRLCGVKPAAWSTSRGSCDTFPLTTVDDALTLLQLPHPPIEVPQCEMEPRPSQSPAPTTSGHLNASGTPASTVSLYLRSTTAVAATLSGGLGGPSNAFVLRRLLLFPACGVDALAAGVEWSSAPLQVNIGSAKGGAHRGAVVGNVLVLLASFALAVLLVTLISFKKQRRCWCDRRRRASLWPMAGRLRLPGVLHFIVGVLYQQTWLSAVILLASGSGGVDIAVGVFGLAVSLFIDAVTIIVLVVQFHARTVPFLLAPASGWRKGLQWLAGRRVDWQPAAEASRRKVFGPGKHFVECYGYLFRSCAGGRQWWLVVDVAATSLLATLTGTAAAATPASSSCCAQQWLFVVACGALCVAGFVLRPKQRRSALGMLWLSDGALFAISLARALTSDVDNVAYEAAATTISALSLLVTLTVRLADKLSQPQAEKKSRQQAQRSVVAHRSNLSSKKHLIPPAAAAAAESSIPQEEMCSSRKPQRHRKASTALAAPSRIEGRGGVVEDHIKALRALVEAVCCDAQRRGIGNAEELL